MTRRKLLFSALAAIVLSFLLLPFAAAAQDDVTITPPDIGGESPRGVVDPDDVHQVAQLVLTGVATGNGFLIAAGIVLLLVLGIRSGVIRRWLPEKAGAVLDHPVVAYSLPFLVASALGLATLAVAPGAVTLSAVGVVLLAAATKVAPAAIAAYVGGKKVVEAKAIAAEAAAKVETKGDALAVLRGPPTP